MSGYQPASSVTPSGWDKTSKTPSAAWIKRKPAGTPVQGRTLIIPSRPAPKIVEDLPIKIFKISTGKLFNLIPLDIINYIDTWIIVLE